MGVRARGVDANAVLLAVLLRLLDLLSKLAQLFRGQEAVCLRGDWWLGVLPSAEIRTLVPARVHEVLAGLDLLHRVRPVRDQHGL